jgi:integrase
MNSSTEEITIQFIESSSKTEKTKQSYIRCINHFKKWLAEYHPALVLEDERVFLSELRPEIFKAFLTDKRSKNTGYSNLNLYRAAIKYLFTVQSEPVPVWWVDGQKEFFAGLRRLEAQERQKGTRKLIPGKNALEFGAYARVAAMLLENGDSFTHLYMILTWNLMCRSSETADITLGHISWSGDAITVLFSKTKNDQVGEFLGDPRHIYANPYNPSICPLLSIGVFCN